MFKVGKPFYFSGCGWTAVAAYNAPRGWYQWQGRGLVYLGESMLDEETFKKMERYAN